MKGSEIRERFLKFFKNAHHTIVPSSASVTYNDPTLLFTNAGMNQFKDVFLGSEKRDYNRATSSQKCLRISGKHNDFENVGVTKRHHTFFEMLGNFSFGDYFKSDAIKFAWQFITEELGLDKNRLWVSILHNDLDSGILWSEITGIKQERIVKMTEIDNFWAMGDTGPCGPCSEIYYYLGDNLDIQSEEDFRKDDGRYLEIWNLVFMQFERSADGKVSPLPKPSIDTGMGLERVASILQKKPGNYEIDLVRPIIEECERLSGISYIDGSYDLMAFDSEELYNKQLAMRVIADHSRAAAFLIADGVIPSNEGKGYALRRIIRRALRHGRNLNFKEPFLYKTALKVIDIFGDVYSELKLASDNISLILKYEENKFLETLEAGIQILEKEAKEIKNTKIFSGKAAFNLFDTYGFPIDLTQDALKTYNLEVDLVEYDSLMHQQRERSRNERKSRNITYNATDIASGKTDFTGYSNTTEESELIEIILDPTKQENQISLIFNKTPFYAESGGQVGDTGIISFPNASVQVVDTSKIRDGVHIHSCKLIEGDLESIYQGAKGILKIDLERRKKITANHSATHILNAALRYFFGNNVKQSGSRVDDKSFRFDFTLFNNIQLNEIINIQEFINSYIRSNVPVITEELPIDEAKNTGAVAVFGEKYGSFVRVVQIGEKSVEFCGGTHVNRTGDIGNVIVMYESSVSTGVRRIECISGYESDKYLANLKGEAETITKLVKGGVSNTLESFKKLLDKNSELESQIKHFKNSIESHAIEEILSSGFISSTGINIYIYKTSINDFESIKSIIDRVRNKIGSCIVMIGGIVNNLGTIVCGATDNLTSSINIGNLLKENITQFGGKGGGKKDFAQVGNIDPSIIGGVLNHYLSVLKQL